MAESFGRGTRHPRGTGEPRRRSHPSQCVACIASTGFSNLALFQSPHEVSRIYAPDDLPDRILLLSPGGDVTMMDIDLDAPKAEWRANSKLSLLSSFMFPKASATFLPPHLVVPLATLVLVFSSTGVIQVCVLSVYEDEIATVLNEETPVDGVSV
jgi:hypothetical protein